MMWLKTCGGKSEAFPYPDFRIGDYHMRFKFIPPFKARDMPPGLEPTPNRLLHEIEAGGLLKGVEWNLGEGVPGPTVESGRNWLQSYPESSNSCGKPVRAVNTRPSSSSAVQIDAGKSRDIAAPS